MNELHFLSLLFLFYLGLSKMEVLLFDGLFGNVGGFRILYSI